MTDDKKPWQHGYDLEYLKDCEKAYKDYNSYALSPFGKYKKNDIARDLADKSLKWMPGGSLKETSAKVKTPITMYQDVVIGYKMPGDTVYSHMRGDIHFIKTMLKNAPNHTWFGHWSEDTKVQEYLRFDAEHWWNVGTKITTFGEMYSIWFKDDGEPFGHCEHPKISQVEQIGVKRLMDHKYSDLVISVKKSVQNVVLDFQNHYSNYNKNKSWSAISLRGYSDDSSMIEKPIEMSKKWKAEHPNWEQMTIRDTPMMREFRIVGEWLSNSNLTRGREIHRVRLMKLTPGGGELERHTDLVDPDSGLTSGKLARLHIPIYTNDKVEFTVWAPPFGTKKTVSMEPGHTWVLDTRKPHMVINNGETDRIHLVVDLRVDEEFENLLLK